ncbi:hypothetical protein BC943DRAFT_52585 [Umbelopsis sp. AD052]|nr:hypothetical protein BC943DRAFT_52585 [Umbelopsis sp. AD052]
MGTCSLEVSIFHMRALLFQEESCNIFRTLASTIQYIFSIFASTALVASACSTGVLHKFLSPYVNSVILHQNPSKSIQSISPNTQITLETLDLLARKKQTTIKLRDLVPAKGSWLTWNIKKDVVQKREQLGKDEFPQTRFWLDQRGGLGDLETMSKIVKVVDEEYKRGRTL